MIKTTFKMTDLTIKICVAANDCEVEHFYMIFQYSHCVSHKDFERFQDEVFKRYNWLKMKPNLKVYWIGKLILVGSLNFNRFV